MFSISTILLLTLAPPMSIVYKVSVFHLFHLIMSDLGAGKILRAGSFAAFWCTRIFSTFCNPLMFTKLGFKTREGCSMFDVFVLHSRCIMMVYFIKALKHLFKIIDSFNFTIETNYGHFEMLDTRLDIRNLGLHWRQSYIFGKL